MTTTAAPVTWKRRRDVLRTTGLRMRFWLVWLASFYGVWGAVQLAGDYWAETLARWPIALAMALGSYVAGSTPMGGGTVGFPVLVLLFEFPPALGRNFGLIIQAIGMTSAAIFILSRRSPVEYRILLWSIGSSAVGLVVGTFWIVPVLADDLVKLVFACLWVSFGVLTLVKNREICAFDRVPFVTTEASIRLGLGIGLVGGITTSLAGVGIDMLLYTVLVLLYRMDLKVAVPTSVIVMAAASILGTLLHLGIGDLDREVFLYWLAASPVVILGAPLGAFFVSVVPRIWTLYFVALLCVFQFFWALFVVEPSLEQWGFVALNLTVATLGLSWLYRVGKRRI